MGLCESEFIEKLPSGAAVAEFILNADLCHLDGTFLGEHLTNSVSQAADNIVLLNGDDPAGLLSRLGDDFAVDGLDRVDVDKACVDPLCLELLYRLERLVNNKTGCDNGNVAALVESDTFAELKFVGLGVVKAVDSKSAEPDIHGAVVLDSRLCCRLHLPVISGVENDHTGDSAHNAHILYTLVSGAVLAC